MAEEKYNRALLDYIKGCFILEKFSNGEEDVDNLKSGCISIPKRAEILKWYYEQNPNHYAPYEPKLNYFIFQEEEEKQRKLEENKGGLSITRVLTTTSATAITLYMILKLFKDK